MTVRLVRRLTFAATYRNDGHATVDRDTTRIGKTDLPVSIGLGLRWQPSERVMWATSYQRKNWGSSDRDIRAQGGIGAQNAEEISTGLEFVKDPKNPGHRPWRIGAHYATLPFPVKVGRQPHEIGFSAGTGIRFTQGRGSIQPAAKAAARATA